MKNLEKKEFSEEKRKELADKGHALPDGSYPIENKNDLKNAIQSIGRAKDYAKVKAHIISRAKALNAESDLPEDWKIKKFFDDVKDLIKSIGTSSSQNEERDERSVENYVRGNSNTNTQIGGNNIVSNTTEPDPKGDIAVQKSVVSGETAPAGNQPVSDAPEGPVPTQETIPSDATSAIAPSKTDEVNTPDTVTIAKGEKCPTCGAIAKGDDTEADQAIEKSADEPESKEEAEAETPADEKKEEMKKSLWGGAFSPLK